MDLSKDIAFFWTTLSDDEILSRVEEVIGQPWPACGGVSVQTQMTLVRDGKIRLRAYKGQSLLVNIDCEKSWEDFTIQTPRSSDANAALELMIVVPHINEVAIQFGLNFYSEDKFRYSDMLFDALGNSR